MLHFCSNWASAWPLDLKTRIPNLVKRRILLQALEAGRRHSADEGLAPAFFVLAVGSLVYFLLTGATIWSALLRRRPLGTDRSQW